MSNHSFNLKQMADKLGNLPAKAKFTSWMSLMRVFAKYNFTAHEVEAILRSPMVDEAIKELGKHNFKSPESSTLMGKYFAWKGLKHRSPIVNKLVCDTFTNVIADKNGIPCYETTNMMSKEKFLEPVDTPYYCSPSSETYWSS